MSLFDRELQRNTFQGNIVLQIGNYFYAKYQPDSGITISESRVGLISALSVNPIDVDFRDVRTSLSTLTFTLLDKDGVVSSDVAGDDYAFQNLEVIFYFGFITGSFPWANYQRISKTRIRSFTKNETSFTFKCEDVLKNLKTPILADRTALTSDITNIVTTIPVTSTASFDAAGIIRIRDEFIYHSGKDATNFTGCTRAYLNTEASSASTDDEVLEVTLVQGKPMDIIYNMIASVVTDSTLINQASFTSLRDGVFIDDPDYIFYTDDIDSVLSWVEKNILIATNTRIYPDNNGKIAIALLDQVVYNAESEQFSEDFQVDFPTYSVDTSRIVNRVIVNTDYNVGKDKFLRTQVFTDDLSIGRFGIKEFNLDLYGVYSTQDTANLIPGDRARRILARLAFPRAEVGVKTFLSKLGTSIGDQVYFSHRYLPQPGIGSTLSQMLEVVSKAPINFSDNPLIQWKLAFTSYSGLRNALISPSPLIYEVLSQKKFTIPAADANALRAGYKLKLMDDTTREVLADAANVIDTIIGNEITMVDDFTTTLTTSIRITFPDYSESTIEQQFLFAYISDNTNLMPDTKSAYLIVV